MIWRPEQEDKKSIHALNIHTKDTCCFFISTDEVIRFCTAIEINYFVRFMLKTSKEKSASGIKDLYSVSENVTTCYRLYQKKEKKDRFELVVWKLHKAAAVLILPNLPSNYSKPYTVIYFNINFLFCLIIIKKDLNIFLISVCMFEHFAQLETLAQPIECNSWMLIGLE